MKREARLRKREIARALSRATPARRALSVPQVNEIGQHRLDAVQRFVALAFEHDAVGKVFRVRGLGGATGVLTEDKLPALVEEAVMGGLS